MSIIHFLQINSLFQSKVFENKNIQDILKNNYQTISIFSRNIQHFLSTSVKYKWVEDMNIIS